MRSAPPQIDAVDKLADVAEDGVRISGGRVDPNFDKARVVQAQAVLSVPQRSLAKLPHSLKSLLPVSGLVLNIDCTAAPVNLAKNPGGTRPHLNFRARQVKPTGILSWGQKKARQHDAAPSHLATLA